MSTLEVIKFRDILPVRAITGIVSSLPPTTIEIVGEDFSSTESIFINEMSAPEFIIVNSRKIYVRLPSNIGAVQTISVRSANFTRTSEASKVEFQIGNTPRTIRGILKLIQEFTRWLLTTPGSDVFNKQSGGGLQKLVGVISNGRDDHPVLSAIVQSVERTERQVKRAQQLTRGLPLDEKLLSATVINLAVSGPRDFAVARVRVESFAGEDALASLPL